MDVMVETLGVEPISAQAVPPLSSAGANMKLALISSDQNEVVPIIAGGAPALGGSSEVAIVREGVSPDRSSLLEEVVESLKRKNSWLNQEMTTIAIRTTNKKRRLVKESELVSSQKGNSSSLLPRKRSSNKASEGKGKEGHSREASGSLPTALISNELGLSFQLSLNSTPTSIVELLSNHVFRPSSNLTDS